MMKIVDPHFHIWDLSRFSYPWLSTGPNLGVFGDNTPIRKDYSLAAYHAETSEFTVRKAVHIEAAIAPHLAVEETRWLDSTLMARDQDYALVAYCNLADGGLREVLEGHAASPRFRGVRQILNRHPDPAMNFADLDYMLDSAWIAGLQCLSDAGLSFDLQIYPHQMETAAALARRMPDLSVILNHTGMPTSHDKTGFAMWREGMHHLADCPNVAVKISGLAMMFHDWTEDMIRPFILETIEMFGDERCMFASNFPVDGLHATFDAMWTAYRNIISGFGMQSVERLMCTNAERVYKL